MQTVDESTMDDVITTIDFATLFSQEELKAKRAEEKDRRKKNRFLSVENSHFLIYLICLLISIVLIAAYLFLPCAETSKWLAVLMSLGASGFGAALLAFFIDRSDTDAQDKAAVDAYNNSVAYIYDTLWTVFGNRSYQYMKKIDKNNGQQIAAQQSAEKFINQFNLAMKAIDSFRLNYAAAMSDEVSGDYSLLKSQLVQFTATLSYPVNVDHLIDALDGTRIWLRGWYSTERLKKHFRFI